MHTPQSSPALATKAGAATGCTAASYPGQMPDPAYTMRYADK